MKIFKNTIAFAALCTIGSVYTKQVGTKSVQPIIPQPTRPVIQEPIQKISTTIPTTTQQPSKQISKELPKSYPSQAQYFLNKIKDLESTGIEIYKMIEEHFAQMPLEEQKMIIEASEDMFSNIDAQADKIYQQYKQSLEKSIDNPSKTVKSTEKMAIINQPYMVTEKNKQLMENNLRIEAQIAFKRIIDDSLQHNIDLGNNDMQHICEKIDSLLRKANIDYTQLGSTNEEQIAHAKMAMDIAEKAIIEQLSQFKTSNLRKLTNYILESNYDNDPRIKNIRRNLSK
jgi:hypothetical protein